MIKAIIFDCFGVLTTEGFKVFCNKYFKNAPVKRAEAQDLMDRSSLGLMPFGRFEQELSILGGTSVETVRDYLSDNKPNEPLFKFMREELKPKYKIGMLSNASANWLPELFLAEDIKLFDDIILSYEVGMAKPNPDLYELAARRLKIKPQESILVDDVDRYCQGAQAAGMQAVLYQDFDQMKTELQKLLNQSA
ncbi:MAG: HAD family phosphatase [Patescibacteria group bacterium]